MAITRLGDTAYATRDFQPESGRRRTDLWRVNLIRPGDSARIETIIETSSVLARVGVGGLTSDGTNLYTILKGSPATIITVDKDTGVRGAAIATLSGLTESAEHLVYHDNGFYIFVGRHGEDHSIYYTTAPYTTLTRLWARGQSPRIAGLEILNGRIYISRLVESDSFNISTYYTRMETLRVNYNNNNLPVTASPTEELGVGSLELSSQRIQGTRFAGLLANPPPDLFASATRQSRGATITIRLEDLTSISSIESAMLTASDNQTATIELTREGDNVYTYTQTRINNRWRSGSVTVIYMDGDNIRRTLTDTWVAV